MVRKEHSLSSEEISMISNVGETDALDKYTNEVLTLKLYSNDITPSETDTAATYTEVSGGGYSTISLPTSDRTIVANNPSTCTYPQKTFTFTGAPSQPNARGYYIINASGVLKGSERFPSAVQPFAPVAGSTVKITPILKAS